MAIQQHPLPQDISSYRFRLIGDMTIKQFAFLAAFIIIGILIYSSPLPFFFKYPLSFISVCLGIGIAFLPIQGRPLDQWIVAFIKSIYSPTQYTWRQSTADATSVINPNTTPVQNQIVSPVTNPEITTPHLQAPVTTPEPITQTPVVEQVVIQPTPTPTPPVQEIPVQTQPIVVQQQVSAPPQTISPSILPSPTATSTTPTQSAAPTTNLPIPFTPTTVNTLVGLTLTPEGKILENVMVEIQSQGLTMRATRSNRLGQFMFARPLENGLYQILAEKEGFKFTAYSLQLKGEIVKPLKIQAEK